MVIGVAWFGLGSHVKGGHKCPHPPAVDILRMIGLLSERIRPPTTQLNQAGWAPKQSPKNVGGSTGSGAWEYPLARLSPL